MLKPSPASAPSSDRPAALVFAPESPYPVIGGGPLRTASVLEYLRIRYALEVITCREPGAPDPRAHFPEDFRVHVLDLPWHSKRAAARTARNVDRWVRGVPPLIDRFSGFSESVARIISGKQFDLGVIEHFWCASYAEVLRPVCRRLALNLHNIESVLLSRCADAERGPSGILFRRWAANCRRLEQKWLPRFDLILAASEADAARLPVPALVYPNAIPYRPLPLEVKRTEEIVFSGNLEYQPNQSAVRWFAREVWPGIRRELPHATWKLIGKNEHGVRALLASTDSISFTGPVDDAVRELARSAVAVAPLISGSGTRVKIIEAWAAGLPVISTTVGAEGLPGVDGRDLILADTPAVFAASVVKVLQTPFLAHSLSASGRRLYEEHLTWEAAWNILSRQGL